MLKYHELSNKLRTHDTILSAYATRGFKTIITLEKSVNYHYVRKYENGDCYSSSLHFTKENAQTDYSNSIDLMREIDKTNLKNIFINDID